MDTARDVASAFVEFDSGSKGFLTRHELRAAHIAILGHPPSLIELDAMLPKAEGAHTMQTKAVPNTASQHHIAASHRSTALQHRIITLTFVCYFCMWQVLKLG